MRAQEEGGERREWGDCVTVLHNTMCTAFTPSLPLSLCASDSETHGRAERKKRRRTEGFKRLLVLMRATWKRCAARRKVIPHYDTVSNNAGDEDKLFRRRGDVESRPPACPRLKLYYQVAFKWVCRVIKVDKTLLPSPSVHLLSDICRTFQKGMDHNQDLVLLAVWFLISFFFFAALLTTQQHKIMYKVHEAAQTLPFIHPCTKET